MAQHDLDLFRDTCNTINEHNQDKITTSHLSFQSNWMSIKE